MRFTSFNIFTAFALLVIIGFTVCATGEKKEAEDQYKTLFNRNTRIFAPPLPRNATFAGESIPLNLYYVREALDEGDHGNYLHALNHDHDVQTCKPMVSGH